MSEVEAGVAGNRAVKLEREILHRDHGLASAVGASGEIGVSCGLPIITLDYLFCRAGHLSERAVGEVEPRLLRNPRLNPFPSLWQKPPSPRHLSRSPRSSTRSRSSLYAEGMAADAKRALALFDPTVFATFRFLAREIDAQGRVTEATVANIFIVRNGVLITPGVSTDLLEGITRASVIAIARDAGIPVEERAVDRTELYIADEAFISGSSARLVPIISIDKRPIGGGVPGAMVKVLSEKYEAAQRDTDGGAYAAWRMEI